MAWASIASLLRRKEAGGMAGIIHGKVHAVLLQNVPAKTIRMNDEHRNNPSV
jgi:hypothetical protein